MTENTSVTQCVSPKRSSKRIKPSQSYHFFFSSSDEEEDNRKKEGQKIMPKKNNKSKKIVSTGVVQYCIAMNCQNKYPTPNLSFFSFPKSLSMRKIWLEKCTIRDIEKIKSAHRVCGRHFEDNMFYNTLKRNRLRANAIPIIFNNRESTFQSFYAESNEDSSSNDDDINIIEFPTAEMIEQIKRKLGMEHFNIEKGLDIHACTVPGCVHSVDFLNKNKNYKPKPVAIYTPSSIENANNWSSVFGVRITMENGVCEKHFKPEDMNTREIFITGTGLIRMKSLDNDAVPKNHESEVIKQKWSKDKNKNEDISKNNTDKSSTIPESEFEKLSKEKNIEIIDSPISILNSITTLNDESINCNDEYLNVNESSNSSDDAIVWCRNINELIEGSKLRTFCEEFDLPYNLIIDRK